MTDLLQKVGSSNKAELPREEKAGVNLNQVVKIKPFEPFIF